MNSGAPEEAANADKNAVPRDQADSPDRMMMSVDLASVPDLALQSGTDQWVGSSLGKYKIKSLLGVGGMGVVFRAHDPSIDREVAIKVLSVELSAN
jgi:serine/threonine protein kinase